MLAWKWTDENAPQRAANFLHLLEGPPAKWQQALDSLLGLKLPEFQTELSKHENINPSFLIRIQKEGFIESSMEPISRFLLKAAKQPVGTTLSELNEEQRKVFKPISETIDREVFDSFVLYGITGSGKTEVYIHAIKKVLELGKTALVLIPEISLTPQTLLRFQAVFGTTIAVLNSRMSDGERQDAWEMVRSGACRIVLGARSAIFAPLPNLGIIVMDEEHDASFKQEDPAPRYHAREVALMRAKLENAVFVGGSATPSLEISHSAGKNRIKWLELPSRHADALLPKVEIIDLREYKHAMRGTLSVALYKAVSEALERKEQIILLQNRRGFAQYLQCEKCGHIPSSPECPVSLTYHKYKNILLCHYSGYSRKADTACEMCGSTELRNMGSGTQSVYENIRELFPAARLMRMDRDTTSTKNAHSKLIHAFSAGEADILIGTQLVAKGLDFPNVTLVGVIDADTELAFPSYRSAERTFQLLSQVAGRAGRAGKPGSVFIQTRNPKSGAIQYAAVHDYKQFAKHELQTRKALQYPPFSRLIGFTFKGKDKDYVAESAFCMADVLSNRMKLHSAVVGPSPSSIARMGDFYYWELMLKIDTEYPTSNIEELLERAMEIYKIETTYKTVRVNIDVGKIR